MSWAPIPSTKARKKDVRLPTIEGVADNQMRRFVRDEQPGAIMERGLRAYSRHPDYVGEMAARPARSIHHLADAVLDQPSTANARGRANSTGSRTRERWHRCCSYSRLMKGAMT